MNNEPSDHQEIIDDLVSIAKKDGIISDDEQNFINTVEREVKNYIQELKKSREDGIITKEEKLQLTNTRMGLIRNVFDTVLKDLTVTDDEQVLMDSLMEKLQDLGQLEE